MRLDRLLSLYVMLLNRKKVNANDLADHFQVSVRTIYRDMEALDMAGLPVTSFPGPQGGFGFIEGYHIDRQVLSFQDILSILTALQAMGTSLANKEIRQVFEKVKSMVPEEKSPRLEEWNQRFYIDMLPWGREKDYQNRLDLIKTSLIENRQIRIQYLNAQGEETLRTIDPYRLSFKTYSWYLTGYCHLRKSMRYFRLSRIKKIELLTSTFCYDHRKGFIDVEQDENTQQFNFKLCFSPYIRARVYDCFSPHQIKEQEDGSVLVQARGDLEDASINFLLGFGEHLKVLEPEELKIKLAQKAEKIISLYKKNQ